jgi:DNA adenine methylase
MFIPFPLPYQGSKRKLAPKILAYFPSSANRLVEPFAGSAAISIAAMATNKAEEVWVNDLNDPLIELWKIIVNSPDSIIKGYTALWEAQLNKEREFYKSIREEFNKDHDPVKLLYLLARCVKAAVRYNSQGEFNQSPDNRRLGMRPAVFAKHAHATSALMKGHAKFTSVHFADLLKDLTPQDVVYMDPPYQGVSGSRDRRYLGGVSKEDIVEFLRELNRLSIPFLLSYDGRLGDRSYGNPLPEDVAYRVDIEAGRSSQSTLLGRAETTVESLYLSLDLAKATKVSSEHSSQQLTML